MVRPRIHETKVHDALLEAGEAGLTQHQVRNKTKLKKSTVSTILNRMVKEGNVSPPTYRLKLHAHYTHGTEPMDKRSTIVNPLNRGHPQVMVVSSKIAKTVIGTPGARPMAANILDVRENLPIEEKKRVRRTRMIEAKYGRLKPPTPGFPTTRREVELAYSPTSKRRKGLQVAKDDRGRIKEVSWKNPKTGKWMKISRKAEKGSK